MCYIHQHEVLRGGRIEAQFDRDDQSIAKQLIELLEGLGVPQVKVWGPNNRYESFDFEGSPTELLSLLAPSVAIAASASASVN